MSDYQGLPEEREKTLGEKRVGLPLTGNGDVDRIKKASIDFIDMLEEMRTKIHHPKNEPNDPAGPGMSRNNMPEVQRLISKAQTDIQSASMFAVAAVYAE